MNSVNLGLLIYTKGPEESDLLISMKRRINPPRIKQASGVLLSIKH